MQFINDEEWMKCNTSGKSISSALLYAYEYFSQIS